MNNDKELLKSIHCNQVENLDEIIWKDPTEDTSVTKGKKVKVIAKKLSKRWLIDAFTGMAQGLFATLIAGTILKQIGLLIDNRFGYFLVIIGKIASSLMGAGIGVGIAVYLKAPKLVVFSSLFAGLIGAFGSVILKTIANGSVVGSFTWGLPGNPIGAYVVTLLAVEIASLIEGKTKVDILLIPISMMLLSLAGIYLSWPFIKLVDYIALGIEKATDIAPFLMGIIIAVSMGILLTMPTSSAAIWIAIAFGKTSNSMLLAGGAAVVGCCAHMVGFAVMSYRENKIGGLISQGLGTSMLQIPNIMQKPILMLPPIVASAIVGPLATVVFKLRCSAMGGGMGTSGLVGIIGIFDASMGVLQTWKIWLAVVLLCFVLPAAICLAMSEIFRKKNIFKFGDLKL